MGEIRVAGIKSLKKRKKVEKYALDEYCETRAVGRLLAKVKLLLAYSKYYYFSIDFWENAVTDRLRNCKLNSSLIIFYIKHI